MRFVFFHKTPIKRRNTVTLKYHYPLLFIRRLWLGALLCCGAVSLLAQESESVKVTVTNGEQIRCITDNTVEVELIPNPQKTLIRMELYWEEDQAEPIIIEPSDDFTLSNTYDLSEFEEECRYDCKISNGFCRQIIVIAKYEGGSETEENNSLILTFKIPPRPNFELNPAVPCINTAAAIENLTCPSNDEALTFSWDFGNGETSDEAEPEVTYDAPGNYNIRLTAISKSCGSESITRSVQIISPAEADAFPDRGISSQDADTFIICGSGSFSTRLIGSESPGATSFKWSSAQSGVNIADRRNDTTGVFFDAPGEYTVTLEVDNGCNQPATQELNFRVVEAANLELEQQPDACAAISYTPEPFNESATYTINGETISSFPVELPPATEPYIVTAALSNACGNLSARDTFSVITPEPVQVTTPAADTSLCENNPPLALSTSVPGGEWTVDGRNIGAEFDPANFGVGSFVATYTVGEPGCETSAQTTIAVLSGPELDIGTDESFCIDGGAATLQASPAGGEWQGTGITDSLAGIFEPQAAGVGEYELRYTFESPSDGCVATATKTVSVVDLPVIDLPDTLAVCNAAEPLDLTALSNIDPSPAGGELLWDGPGITDAAAGLLDTEAAGGEGLVSIRLTYTIPPGCVQRDSMALRIDPLVTAVAPPDTTLCSNQEPVRLEGMPAGGIWLRENGQEIDNPIDPNQLGAGTFALTYMLNRGTTCETSDATALTIVAGDGVSAGEDRYVCETADAIELPAVNGQWSGPSLSAARTVAVSALDTGRYAYTLTDPSLPPACNSDELTLFVRPLPRLDFTPDTTSCTDSLLMIDNQSEGDRFFWDFGDGETSTEVSPSHTYRAAGTYDIRLRVETLSPINNQLVCEAEESRQIRIFEPPEFVGFTTDVQEGCTPLTVDFNNQSRGERLSFTWDFGDGRTSTETAPQDIEFTAGLYDTTYQVRLTVDNGCGGEAATVPVNVWALPSAEFATEVTGQYCSGEIVDIGHRSLGDSLYWDFGNGQTYTGFEPPSQQYFTSLDNDTVRLSLEAVNRCGRDTARQELVIVPTDARAAISVLDDRPCVGDTVFLRSLSRPIEAPVEWLFPDGSSGSGTETFYVFQNTGPQTITSKVYSCGLDSTDLAFEVQPAPEVELFAPPQTCPKTALTVELNGSEVRKAIFLGDSLISNSDRLVIQLDSLGPVTLTGQVESPEGCIVRTERVVEVIEGPAAEFAMVDSVCAGAPVALESTSSRAASCLWKTSEGVQLDECLTQYAFANEGAQSAKLIVTNNIGCKDSIEKTVFIRPTPEADFTFDILEPCTPARVAFSDASARANALRWELPGGAQEVRQNFTFTFENSGALPVRLIASNDGICFDTVTRSLTIFGSPEIEIEKIASCTQAEGYELQISTQPPAQVTVDGPDYGGAGSRHQGLQPGDYFIFAETENGCIADSVTSIPRVDELFVRLAADTIRINLGESVVLPAAVNQADALINWTPAEYLDDPSSASPVATPFQSADFVIEVTDMAGCVKLDTTVVIVTIDRERGLYIPNAFTPDGSGHNDVFRVRANNAAVTQLAAFRVFDQNGNLVFERKDCDPGDPACAWDGTFRGKDTRPGVYVYQINVEFVDGKIIPKEGDVTLIR